MTARAKLYLIGATFSTLGALAAVCFYSTSSSESSGYRLLWAAIYFLGLALLCCGGLTTVWSFGSHPVKKVLAWVGFTAAMLGAAAVIFLTTVTVINYLYPA